MDRNTRARTALTVLRLCELNNYDQGSVMLVELIDAEGLYAEFSPEENGPAFTSMEQFVTHFNEDQEQRKALR